MKYFVSIFVVLALVGGGCVSSEELPVNTSNDAESETAVEEPIIEESDEAAMGQQAPSTTTDFIEEAEADEEGVVEIMLGSSADVSADMESGNFFFAPDTLTAAPGDKVEITFTANTGFHTFVIDEIDLKFTVAEGETFTFTVPDEPGSYSYYCDVGSHRTFGMEGTLIVQ